MSYHSLGKQNSVKEKQKKKKRSRKKGEEEEEEEEEEEGKRTSENGESIRKERKDRNERKKCLLIYPSQPSLFSRFAWYLSSSCRSPWHLSSVFWIRVRIRLRTGAGRLSSINVRTAARVPSVTTGACVSAFFIAIHSTYNNPNLEMSIKKNRMRQVAERPLGSGSSVCEKSQLWSDG